MAGGKRWGKGGEVNDAGAPSQGPKLFSLLKPRQEGPFLVLCSSETMLQSPGSFLLCFMSPGGLLQTERVLEP